MKVKLLKKIRKRFSWYIGVSGSPVLVDHKNKTIKKINESFYRKYVDSLEGPIKGLEIPLEEACFRLLKTFMLKPYNFDYGDINYNKAKNLAKRHKNFKDENN
jgi:hypothetical protein